MSQLYKLLYILLLELYTNQYQKMTKEQFEMFIQHLRFFQLLRQYETLVLIIWNILLISDNNYYTVVCRQCDSLL